MSELTILLLIFSIGLYVVSMFTRRNDLSWLVFFMTICSIGATLTDEALSNDEMVMAIMPVFFIMILSGLAAMGFKDNTKR